MKQMGRCGVGGSCCLAHNRLSVLTELNGFRGKGWDEVSKT